MTRAAPRSAREPLARWRQGGTSEGGAAGKGICQFSRTRAVHPDRAPALAGDWAFETLSSVGVSMRRLAKARWQGLDKRQGLDEKTPPEGGVFMKGWGG